MSGGGRPGAALGLDIGTSGARALVVTDEGCVLGEGSADYLLFAETPGHAEQEPQDWWRAAVSSVRAALASAGLEEVDGIGVTGQMHGTVLVDERLDPLRRALLWCDSRAAGDAAEVTRDFGRAQIIRAAGNLPMPGFTAPQLRWLTRATQLGSARWVMCAKDYVRAKLTGEVATDPSDASGTGLLALDGGWSDELAHAYGIDPQLLPPVIEAAEVAGHLTRTAATEIGLPQGTPVATGAADNAAAALGTGVIAPGKLLLSVGTSGTIVVPVPDPRPDETGRCHLFRHAVPETWYAMAVVLSAGGALTWWQSVTGQPLDELGSAARAVAPGSDGVVMLPFLSGRRMPVIDPEARAVFSGMSLSHGVGHLTRAVIEGAAFAMAEGLECIRDLGIDEEDAVVTGAAARHRVWLEVLALALPDLRLSTASPGGGAALGAALLAFAAAGAPLDSLVRQTVVHAAVDSPQFTDAEYTAVASGYDRYRSLASTTSGTAAKETS